MFLVTSLIAGRVFAEPKIRGRSDQDALGQDLNRARQDEPIREDLARVHPAVAILVFEDHNPPDCLILPIPVHIRHEATHLNDVESTFVIPIHRNGIDDEGFGSHELNPKTRRDSKGVERLGRRKHGGIWPFKVGKNRLRRRTAKRYVGQHEE
jgi:hypothetical protein